MIRKARISDAKAIHQLLMVYAKEGLVLSRSLADLYEDIRDFYLYEEEGEVLGAVSLHICWEDLAEVRSLVVSEKMGGKGIGRVLVESCIEEAKELGIAKVFALTYKEGFFAKCGFSPIEKSELPHKIWRDCINCPKFPECDEVAVGIEL